mgnify:CR=1 FL=1
MKSHLPPNLEPVSLIVTPAAIEAYAQLTQDFNPIHLDPEFAARTPMGGVIAHGTMSVGLIWRALAQSLLPDDFVKPIRLQETVVAGGRLQAGNQPIYDVWVQGADDGVERIVGTAQLPA